MQMCKGICKSYYDVITSLKMGIWHKKDASFCSVCSVFMITGDVKCGCCKTIIRKRPRARKEKERLLCLKV